MAFELQQLRQVLALAEHGSFVRAAAALHISQPALSRSIQNLERRFGSELFLGPAAVRFIELYPRVRVQLHSRDWDDLLRQLRSRELDFFVAEFSTMQRDHDLEIAPMPTSHALHFVARAGHPLGATARMAAEEILKWPLVTPSRIPPRVLDPMLAARFAQGRRARRPARGSDRGRRRAIR